jgi:hypothetical protein
MQIGDYVVFHSDRPEWQKVQNAMGVITMESSNNVYVDEPAEHMFFVVFAVDPPGVFWCRAENLRVIDEREYFTLVAAATLTQELTNADVQ